MDLVQEVAPNGNDGLANPSSNASSVCFVSLILELKDLLFMSEHLFVGFKEVAAIMRASIFVDTNVEHYNLSFSTLWSVFSDIHVHVNALDDVIRSANGVRVRQDFL
jgi:hypothetical protein